MAVSLYDHQVEAVRKLRAGSILLGGVGSGKSRTALVYYILREGQGSVKINGKGAYRPMKHQIPLYIITTAKKRDTLEWEAEFPALHLDANDITIDSWNRIQHYVDVKNAFFIFDEQRVIGSGTWVKSFLKIAKKNRWILLTATPGDTWMDYIPVFIANGYYKNRTEFLRKHVVFNRFLKFPKVDRYLEENKLQRLRDEVLIGMDYVNPTISNHYDIWVTYDEELYKQLAVERWNIYDNEPVREAGQLCYLLRKVVNSDFSRKEALVKLTKKHDRIIVFYNFNYELEILREIAVNNGIPVAEWNGHKHEIIPDTNHWLYLVQYAAGAEGWNCIETDTIVFYSQNYSYKAMVQAAGRIDRLNTPYNILHYYHFKTKASIDMGIQRYLKQKKTFNEKAFLRSLGYA